MWVVLNSGLISIVANKSKGFQGTYLVRARRRKDLHAFFGGDPKSVDEYVIHTPDSDYHYRVMADADTLKAAMFRQIDQITYGNFKNSIPEGDMDLKHFATETWLAGYRNLGETPKETSPVLTSVNTKRNERRR